MCLHFVNYDIVVVHKANTYLEQLTNVSPCNVWTVGEKGTQSVRNNVDILLSLLACMHL